MAAGHPLQGVDITQAARAAFNIGFKVIAGAVIALVALVLFFDFGGEKLLRRTEAFTENMLLQLQKKRHVADQQTCFNQIGGDG